MKLFYYYSPNFVVLRDRFLGSLKDNFNINEARFENFHTDGSHGGGLQSWERAVGSTLQAIKDNMGEVILKCDVDINFYQPVIPLIESMIQGKDIIFQRELSNFGVNIGFMAIRCSERTFNFWSKVYRLSKRYVIWDQGVCNMLLHESQNGILWGRFPSSVWCKTQVELPESIIVHHANLCSGVESKLEQLNQISALYDANGRLKQMTNKNEELEASEKSAFETRCEQFIVQV